MRKLVVLLLSFLLGLLPGCGGGQDATAQAMDLRARLLSSNGYTFDTEVTADFGDKVYTFSMNCRADNAGNVTFTVILPETIAGISGVIDSNGGKITFDDVALAFGLLADGRLTPVSAPWVLVHTLHYGYITACAQTDSGVMISINDSYEDEALNLSVYLGRDGLPAEAEIFWNGRRVLSLTVKNFTFR